MENTTSVSVEIAPGKTIVIETGLLAAQAAGAVTVTMGETVMFSAVTNTDEPREGIDFFPLQVEYREKFYAAGRFPGGFFKREARPSEKEILTARFTDRPIRPLFPAGYHNDVQINNMTLSLDGSNDSDVLSIVASSAALTISEIPFLGPIGGVRVGRIDGQFVVNPTQDERDKSDLELIYVGTRDLPMMIEGGAQEISEADLVAAMRFGHEACVKLCDAQLELRRKLGKADKVVEMPAADTTLIDAARSIAGADLTDALLIPGKQERESKVHEIKSSLKEKLAAQFGEGMSDEDFRVMFDNLEIEIVRSNVIERGKRIDGRPFDALRPLSGSVDILPRTHGSALFARGETQALCTATLGTSRDSQSMDAIAGGPTEKNFLLHYNFPPYSVGECGRLGSTNRREIGHGNLAERALKEVIPADYPYTIRLVSDVMSSNGSTSMASVCSGTMALMDAGVPIKAPVAGISVGLFSGPAKDILVLDILGWEDHCGDMDFKVTGTRKGITSFQVDLKITGLKWELVEGAFDMARKGRMEILDAIESVISQPNEDLKPHAPRINVLKIDPEKIGELIGPGGKNIRRITDTLGVDIDISDDGTVKIFSAGGEAMAAAVREVEAIAAEVEVGAIYNGTVKNIREFGAFVEVLPGKDGLVHISELADFRVEKVEDICKEGESMWVKCIGIDERGRVRLSRKEAMAERDAAEAAVAE
jgi:polyribonucleotide nucleotidyltransferase